MTCQARQCFCLQQGLYLMTDGRLVCPMRRFENSRNTACCHWCFAGARVVCSMTGEKGILVIEPVLPGAESSHLGRYTSATPADDDGPSSLGAPAATASAAATASTSQADDMPQPPRGLAGRLGVWLGVHDDDVTATTGRSRRQRVAGWRLHLIAARTPQQMVQVREHNDREVRMQNIDAEHRCRTWTRHGCYAWCLAPVLLHHRAGIVCIRVAVSS